MTSVNLVKACKNNCFPDLATMTKYGLDGVGGTNPLSVLKCFQEAVRVGMTSDDIDKYFENGTISQIILENTMEVKYLDCYEQVLQRGGIKSSWNLPQLECTKCKLCAIHNDDICNKCGYAVKR